VATRRPRTLSWPNGASSFMSSYIWSFHMIMLYISTKLYGPKGVISSGALPDVRSPSSSRRKSTLWVRGRDRNMRGDTRDELESDKCKIESLKLIKMHPFCFAVSSVAFEQGRVRLDTSQLICIYFCPRSAEKDFLEESLTDPSDTSSPCCGSGLKGVHWHQVLVSWRP
jgi:hypothetical protein